MSLEFLLAIVFFALLPLIERLLRAAREGGAGAQGPARPQRPPQPPPAEEEEYDEETYVLELPPMPAPRLEKRPAPSIESGPVKPRMAPSRAPSRVPSRVTAHDRRTDDAFKNVRARRGRRGIAAALHTEAGVRHAVVLMTILGPCRAFEPYDR